MTEDIQRILFERTRYHLKENLKKIETCLTFLNDEDFWSSPGKEISPIGNQILHLEGNMRQWILHGIYGDRDQRDRNWEFEVSGLPMVIVLEKLRQTIDEVNNRMFDKKVDLRVKTDVQDYFFDGVGKLMHVTEHVSYHTAQIILISKLLRQIDVDFYPDVK